MDYKVHLKQFDGPLDLLIHLIQRAELDIKDVFVSDITSEFLEYLKGLDELDMDSASEFLTVAATLVYMKSRSLFPPEPKEEGEDEDPGETLIRQLREYKVFKETANTMRELAHKAALMRGKLPDEFPLPPKEIILRNTTVQGLYDAMMVAIGRCDKEEPRQYVHSVNADRYTIRSCTKQIRAELQSRGGSATFDQLICGAERMEIIVTFMSLLEMIVGGEIRLNQSEYCGKIVIFALKLLKDDEKVNYMDELE